MTPVELCRRLRSCIDSGAMDLPLPGRGHTARRHRELSAWGRSDLSFARLAEAHTDAVAILAEDGRRAHPSALYGVWASEPQGRRVMLRRRGAEWSIDGSKPFCTGVEICDRALVTVWTDDSDVPQLLDVDVAEARRSGSSITDTSAWATPAFASTSTGSITFLEHPVPEGSLVGAPGWYLDRPGFWHGAIGPAAVWAGGGFGLVDAAELAVRESVHSRAELGALRALRWSLEVHLQAAGQEIDADPSEVVGARRRALIVRHLVERDVEAIVHHFGRAVGPGPLAFDHEVVRRLAELQLYVRQSHGRDDVALIAGC